MDAETGKQSWLTAAQCAERIGMTVRALRQETGLIRPPRTGKNWRLYGTREIARLTEILALKRLGLSLQDIARLLAGHATDLDRMLAMQNLTLQDQLTRTQCSLAAWNAFRLAQTSALQQMPYQEICFVRSGVALSTSTRSHPSFL